MTELNPILPCLSHLTQRDAAFQRNVQDWLLACFGSEIANDKIERNHRFLEESLELVQSAGCTVSEAHQLVDYVFGRRVGETEQEVGGVMNTLAALCLAHDLDMMASGEKEMRRVWTMVEKIRAKQATKPKHSPLPEVPGARDAAIRDEAVHALQSVLNEAGLQFKDYARQHLVKTPPDHAKAQTNNDWARRCFRAARYPDFEVPDAPVHQASSVEPPVSFEGTRVTDPPFTARHADLLNLLACVLRDNMDDAGRGADADVIEEKRAAAFPAEAKP